MRKLNKTNKILLIVAISLILITAITILIIAIIKNKAKVNQIEYTDKLTCKNYFSQMTIDLTTKEVKRDETETSLKEEFGIDEEQEKLILSSRDELKNFLDGSSFELNIEGNIVYITNIYQTKRIILETEEEIKGEFRPEAKEEIEKGINILTYTTYSKTKAAYEYFKSKNISATIDEIYYIEKINDVSQTMYGTANEEKELSRGINEMGLDNYKNIIEENKNEEEVIVATIGYGIQKDNQIFNNRLDEKYYNFIKNSVDISETITQGSRIAEVIVNSTTENVKLMPIVVVNKEGYSSVSVIVKAIIYSTANSDVICYEITHKESEIINKVLSNAFKENKPFCCVSIPIEEDYPAKNQTTIAVSSLNREKTIAEYSGKGEYIDFSIPSTDVKEIFDTSSSVSRWSGAQYSNANIVAAIALIKSYDKELNILEIYNFLRNYCDDLGEKGKDKNYGYGMPNFKELTIASIDKQSPEIIEVSYSDENWEKTKNITIKAKDNIRIKGWQITKDEVQPAEWNVLEEVKSELEVKTEVTEKGKYYIWVSDTAGNMQNKEIEITKIDNKGPDINYNIDSSTINNGYITINITAEDSESGLNDLSYSWDGSNWGANSNSLQVTENGIYTIYVKDKMDNISNKEIKITLLNAQGIAEIGDGVLIKKINVSSEWNEDTNNSVQITFNNNIKITEWQITIDLNEPSYFHNVNLNVEEEKNKANSNNKSKTVDNRTNTNNIIQASSNIEITAKLEKDIEYYVWVKDENKKTYKQTFKIKKIEI